MYGEDMRDSVFGGSPGFILSNFQTNQPTFKRNLQFQGEVPGCPKDYHGYAYQQITETPVEETASFMPQFEGVDYPKSLNESFVVVDVNEPFNILYASQGWLDMMQCSAEELESQNLHMILGNDLDQVRSVIAARYVESEAMISLKSRSGRSIRTRVHASAASEWQGVQSCTLTMTTLAEDNLAPATGSSHDIGSFEPFAPAAQSSYEPEENYNTGCYNYEALSPFNVAPDTPPQVFQQAPKVRAMHPTYDESPVSVTQHSFFWVPPLAESSNTPCWQNNSACEDGRNCSTERDDVRHYPYPPEQSCSHQQPAASPPSPLKRSRSMISADQSVPPLAEETQASSRSSTTTPHSELPPSLPQTATAKKPKPAPRSFLRLVPRRKGGKDAQGDGEEVRGGCGKAVELTREKIEEMSGKSLKQAAAEMGLAASTLKKACRRIGIERWPHRPEAVSPQLPPSLLYDSAYVRRLQCKYADQKTKSPKSPEIPPRV
mmetsp:Transcript_130594/g.194517  ORF Transcript_130594/g.194517 Transcript_130594/m.194517 type:complete len:490 (-) Transcript_130594:363-1832(-)